MAEEVKDGTVQEATPEVPVGPIKVEKGEVTPAQAEEIETGQYVTIKQIAGELSYTHTWILELVRKGRIKGIKPLGGRWRIPRSEYNRIKSEGIPPLPRESKEKPPVTEISVGEEKVRNRVREPEKKGEPPLLFPFSLLGGGRK